jgi:hypothetical protein
MIPQITDTLLEIFIETGVVSTGEVVYDPFVGSGTTIVSAKQAQLHGVGNDINPYAVKLTQTKTNPIRQSDLQSIWFDITENILSTLDSISAGDYTDTNINSGWFPEKQESQLLYIRSQLDDLEDSYRVELVRPFRIILGTIARKCSFQRNGEYKRYRMPEEDRETHNPSVKELFIETGDSVVDRLIQFSNSYEETPEAEIYLEDSRDSSVPDASVDAVITSPPYGDHDTTVAYGQFSRDPSIIAFGNTKSEMLDVDKTGLGGRYSEADVTNLVAKSDTLAKTVEELDAVDGRSDDALQFFQDYFLVMEDVHRVLKQNQPVVWVVANRTMSRVPIPTQLITKELCESIGFSHSITLPRSIPSKTLPWDNAPENETGNTGSLMADENIVILTK